MSEEPQCTCAENWHKVGRDAACPSHGIYAAPTGPIPADAATPRTNDATFTDFGPAVVYAFFARRIERELTQALKERDEARHELNGMFIFVECPSCLGTGEGKHDRGCSVCDGRKKVKRTIGEYLQQTDSLRAQLAAVTQERDNLAAAYAFAEATLAKRDKEKQA